MLTRVYVWPLSSSFNLYNAIVNDVIFRGRWWGFPLPSEMSRPSVANDFTCVHVARHSSLSRWINSSCGGVREGGGGVFVMAQSRRPCSSCFISPPPLQRCCRGEALFARFASAAPDFFLVRGAMWMNLISFVSPTNHTNGQRFSL